MKKLFLVLAALGLALGSAHAGYVILDNELEPYAKSAEVVSSVRDLTRDIELEEGDNVSIAVSNNTISIAADVPAQVQADWSEDDSGSPAYIAHKPEVLASNAVAEIARYVVDNMTSVGWEVDGTWYRLVVQTFVPPPPAETTFTLSDGTEATYDIVGTLDYHWMIDNEWFDGNSWEWLVNITSADIGSSVTEIGDSAFYECGDLTSVTIGSSVATIGNSAFAYCSNLTSVTIPDSVMWVDDYAFSGCSGLTNVTIGGGVTSIGGEAFSACSGLTSVTIGDSVTNIDWGAFIGCSNLTSVTIPGSVTNIGGEVFSACGGLMDVTMSGKTTTQVSGMSDYPWSLPSGCVITCSDGTLTVP